MIKKSFSINKIYAKLVQKNTVPRMNYTQLYQLGVWGALKAPKQGPGQIPGSFSF